MCPEEMLAFSFTPEIKSKISNEPLSIEQELFFPFSCKTIEMSLRLHILIVLRLVIF